MIVGMTQNNKVIGLTGGIATGKSTASNIIKKLGYKIIDADKLSRQVVEKGKSAYNDIVNYFGKEVIDENGNINRKALGKMIFDNHKLREKLNNIIHPYVFKAIKELLYKNRNEKIIFIDAPLLIEKLDKFNGYGIKFDEIWLIYVNEKTQLERLMKRDAIKKEDGIKRIRAQIPIEIKKKYATRIIDNSGSIRTLEEQIQEII
ncbi:dephospho-CoA kinase [Schnuerera sp. xch1]|uniref:dephospho-CoA kinase n=1 Tax=Schnuerera sp. xch1 TaxID=2874283 RepID=UPI001CC04B33|nr:dephospho-CoA kinase [Schnuerera sp. xch1]